MSENRTPSIDQPSRPGGTKVINCHEVADHVYEVEIRTANQGSFKRRILVLPSSAIGEAVSGRDCGER